MEPQVLEGQLLVMQEILRGDRSKKGTGSQGDESAAAEEAEGSRSQSGGPELKDAEGSLRRWVPPALQSPEGRRRKGGGGQNW